MEAGVANLSCQTGGTESCPSFHRDQARWEHRRVARGEDKIRRKKAIPQRKLMGQGALRTNVTHVLVLLMLLDKSLQNAGGWWCRTHESVLQCSLAVLFQYCYPEVETHGSSLLSLQPSPALHYQKHDHPKEKYPVAFL